MSLRSQVLACYRALHRTRRTVFAGDVIALEAGKQKLREEFSKNKHEVDPDKIKELIKIAEDTERMLRCHVVQGVRTEEGSYRLQITKDTMLQNNATMPGKTKE